MLLPLLLVLGAGGAYWFFFKKPVAAPALPKGGKGAPGEPPPAPVPQPGGGDGPPVHPPSPVPTPALGGGGGVPNFDLHFPGGSAYANNPVYIAAYQGALAYLAQAMNQPSWNPGAISGTLNAATKSAVMAFQRSQHLTADGMAGPMTASALTKVLASTVAHTGQGIPVCQGDWVPLGEGLQHAPPHLRLSIALAGPSFAAHPQCPPPGSSFAANVSGTLVLFYCAAYGHVIPTAYCASLAQAGWMIPDYAHPGFAQAGWQGPGNDARRMHTGWMISETAHAAVAQAGWKHSDDRSRGGRRMH